MGLMDFFKKKGDEKVTEIKPGSNANQTTEPKQAPLKQAPHQAEYQHQTYVVKEGDSLSKIAMEYYGNVKEWNKILEANKDHISDPNKIKIGQKLIIPK